MAKTFTIKEDQTPTQEQLEEIRAAAKREIQFDEDSAELSLAMFKAKSLRKTCRACRRTSYQNSCVKTFPRFPFNQHGENPLLIKERLGHEKIQTTLGTYGHLYPNSNLEVANKLTSVLTYTPASHSIADYTSNQHTAIYHREVE